MDNGATKSGYIKAWTCPHCRALNVARRCGCAASREANTHACVDLDSIALERRLVSHGRCSAALDLLAYVASRPRGRRNPHPNYAEHQDALDRVRAVAELAGQLDPWAHFYAFGTCSVDCAPAMQLPFGKLDPYVRPEPL